MLEIAGGRSQRWDGCIEEFCDTVLKILQSFPARTEGSVKKHWYKVCGRDSREGQEKADCIQDMHYADFAEDEVI